MEETPCFLGARVIAHCFFPQQPVRAPVAEIDKFPGFRGIVHNAPPWRPGYLMTAPDPQSIARKRVKELPIWKGPV
jgi:hypothetical protein